MSERIREAIRLTQYSHGAGCGCKISPSVLDSMLEVAGNHGTHFTGLLVGNEGRDDAAVFDLGDGTAIISTTDFFMPIVDDPETFGKIAAANAISDIYAMGGTPMMAIAILGWPVNVLPPEIAGKVIHGGQAKCHEAGIPLAGGHSIDSPEPIFGLAVTGRVAISNLKKNGGSLPGDILLLTKPIGVGILSTAQKKEKLLPHHQEMSVKVMVALNNVGQQVGKVQGVRAMTDITGFGLAGHLIEMCRASNTSAILDFVKIPLIDASLHEYIKAGCIPGGTDRNLLSYGKELRMQDATQRYILCDPQTSGGLLLSVAPGSLQEVKNILKEYGVWYEPIGRMVEKTEWCIEVI